MEKLSHHYKIGASTYRIDFEGNSIRFYYIGKKAARWIGNASFQIHGSGKNGTALFNGGIMHRSPRIVEELADLAENAFREQHPNIHIVGHRTWFHPRKPPFSRSHSEPKPRLPQRKIAPRRL